ncbi:hypothetical protein M1C59_20050 [Gordonia terrae]|uniref:hypothetical protein n=1 Tax=Gordonia terrae TaxID=2055 RepID=UPI00200A8406|nr:hypothetical protein [Gordonia terrae]UPW08326.1 hypothetical protein M1C59_20050 [Gordonia terrae]
MTSVVIRVAQYSRDRGVEALEWEHSESTAPVGVPRGEGAMVATSIATVVGEANPGRHQPGVGERYWGPGDPDFGTAVAPRFEFADPHAAGLFHAKGRSGDFGERVTIGNRGERDAAVVVLLADGRTYLDILIPGSEAPLPEGDSLTYVQAPRTADGRPVLYGAVWVRDGRVMPVTLPIPTRHEFLDHLYLTPWSPEWNGGVSGRQILDAAAAGISYQYRTGGSTFLVRNSGRDWIGVVHRSGADLTSSSARREAASVSTCPRIPRAPRCSRWSDAASAVRRGTGRTCRGRGRCIPGGRGARVRPLRTGPSSSCSDRPSTAHCRNGISTWRSRIGDPSRLASLAPQGAGGRAAGAGRVCVAPGALMRWISRRVGGAWRTAGV